MRGYPWEFLPCAVCAVGALVLASCSPTGGTGTDAMVEEDLGGQCSPYAGCCKDSDCAGFGEQCSKQACVGGECVSQPEASGTICDDESQCTMDDKCDGNGKCSGKVAKGMECDDGDLCTQEDECSALGQCEGTPVVCDDSNDCTADQCDSVTGKCANNALDGGSCQDGSSCTTGDTCQNGQCKGTPIVCPSSDCLFLECEETTGKCSKESYEEAGVKCKDGNPCTDNDTCDGNGVCLPGKQHECNAGHPCKKSACIETKCKEGEGCNPCENPPSWKEPGVGCDDGDSCTSGDACTKTGDGPDLACTGIAVPCNDDNPCTTDSCKEDEGCVFKPASNGISCVLPPEFCGAEGKCLDGTCSAEGAALCDDGIACTVGKCKAGGECVQVPDDAFCDDGLACNGLETCDPVDGKAETGCADGIPMIVDDGIDCTVDTCDENEDMPANLPDHEFCDDKNPCNGVEACSPKDGCIAGTPMDCNDKIDCTTDDCSPGTGTCKHDPSDTLCDDANPCTEDGCVEGEGCKYTLLEGLQGGILCCPNEDDAECNDKDSCTVDKCDLDLHQCTNTLKANGALCDDGQKCTKDDTCQLGKCLGKADPCDDGLACTKDSCGDVAGCTHEADDNFCDDTNVCTGTELCNPAGDPKVNPGGCESVNPLTCVDQVACTQDGCDSTKGCAYTPDDTKCDDANECTADTCDAIKGCLKAPKLGKGCCVEEDAECDDLNSCTLDKCDVPKFKCELSVLADGMACNDKNLCTKEDKCLGGTCGGTQVNCVDDWPCTTDSCDPLAGCQYVPNDSACNDSNVCTNDSCDKTAGCKHTDNDGVDCNDGKADTVDDICSQGDCIGMADPDLDGIANSGYLLPCVGGQTARRQLELRGDDN